MSQILQSVLSTFIRYVVRYRTSVVVKVRSTGQIRNFAVMVFIIEKYKKLYI